MKPLHLLLKLAPKGVSKEYLLMTKKTIGGILQMNTLMELANNQGLGYTLFVALFIWVLKKQEKRDINSEKRESKYQEIITELTSTVNVKLDKLIDRIEK